MTYNILKGGTSCPGCAAMKKAGYADELDLKVRMPAAAAKIAYTGPAIVGIQENENDGKLPLTYLLPELPGYAAVNAKKSVPILYLESLFTLVDSGFATLEKPGVTCYQSDKTAGRYVSWAKLQHLETGGEIVVLNTHLHPGDSTECAALRAESITKIRALIDEVNPAGLPIIVTGDFNTLHGEEREGYVDPLDKMWAAELVDAFDLADADLSDVEEADSANWMKAEIDGVEYAKAISTNHTHIDYIWLRDSALVTSWMVFSGPEIDYRDVEGQTVPFFAGVLPSDHSPVIADVTLTFENR
jgi:endonuclease/exonuclease/phosphatase family metal-dependent hydrolase